MELCSCLLILLAACCLPQLLYTGLFILGSVQVLSIMLWLYFLDEEPNKLWSGLLVRFAFMLVVMVASASCCNHDMHFMAYLASLTYPVPEADVVIVQACQA